MGSSSANLIALFESAIRTNWESRALSDYGGESFTYADTGNRIVQIHALFRNAGLKKGDHVALLGKNSAHWGMIYLATITYGAVIVPILPDFKPADVHFIVTHSDSVLLFVEESIFRELNTSAMPLIKGAFRSLYHEHYFETKEGKTEMTDIFMYETPFGVFGALFNILVLRRYMTRFLNERNAMIKNEAEGKV